MAYFAVLVFLLVGLTHKISSEETCQLAAECITDLTQKDCPADHILKPDAIIEGCCPKCEAKGPIPDICMDGIPDYECPFGMICDPNGFCVYSGGSCLNVLLAEPKPKYLPSCDLDGTYAPVQCKGDAIVGRCFCSDKKGKRIFGIAWAADAADMTCACSRRRNELEAEGRTDVTLHCDRNGNYEPLQCDSELCWCVNTKTGDPTSAAVIGDLVSQLPCYDSDTLGSQYLRICESKAHAIAVMKNILAVHGTPQVTMETVNCDYDGTYGVYQIEKGIAYCSWKDGSRIGSWMTQADSSLKYMNCNCARDTKYFEEAGKVMTQSCSSNGNYRPDQEINGQQYCVDSDGYATTDIFGSEEVLTCV